MSRTDSDEVYTPFHLSRDVIVENNWGINQPVTVGQFSLGQNFIQQSLTALPEQTGRLLNHFNNFQQFTIRKVTATWMPQYTREGVVYQNVTNPDNTWIYLNGPVKNAYVTALQDLDDTYGRSSLDEYYQARDQRNAKTWNIMDTESYSYTPFVMDAVGQVNNFARQSTFSSDSPANQSAPIPFKWFATKATNDASLQVLFNIYLGSLGFKYYIYLPWTNSPATSSVKFGMWRYDVEFAFRYPDYRAPITMAGFNISRQAQEEMEALIAIHGEQARMLPIESKPEFLSDLGVAYKKVQDESATDPNGETYQRVMKRLRTKDSEASTSPQTQQSQTRRVPPVSPSLK